MKTDSEVKEKMSQMRQGKPGKKHSEDTKKKLSIINKGKTIDEVTKKKISDGLKRKHAERKAR